MAGGSQASPALELERLDGVAGISDPWSALAHAASNPFATVEWCVTWLTHTTDRYEPRLFEARRRDGSLVAVIPLVIVHGRHIRRARFVGFGAAYELGPICAPADSEDAINALRRVLRDTRHDWDLFIGDHLPGTGWADRLGGTLYARRGDPVIDHRGDWNSYLDTRSAHFRKDLRQRERRLERRDAQYRTVSDLTELGSALDALFDLHRARWGEEASTFFEGLEAFHRAFAEIALERGWLRLRLLEIEGQVVAAYHGIRFGDSEWFYALGRDRSEDSVGVLIVAHSIQQAFEEGATRIRLGPGAQPYKLRYATSDPGLDMICNAHGLRGRLMRRIEHRPAQGMNQ